MELKIKSAMKSGRYQDDTLAQYRTLANAIEVPGSYHDEVRLKGYP